MEFYESRRARRLRTERARHTKRRRIGRGIAAISTTLLLIILAIVVWRAINASVERVKIEQAKLAEQKRIETPPSYKIKRDLPAKISELNQNLGLPQKINSTYLPTAPAVAVSIIDLSDKNRGNVDYGGDTQFTSASTYKLFIAYAMIRAVETGQMKWTSALNRTTLNNCFEKMILDSDNACAEAYLARIGYSNFNKLVDDLGVSDQTQFAPNNMRTSANDLALFLQKLYRGELMSAENQQKLLDSMKNQRYRDGIPAGIAQNNATENSENPSLEPESPDFIVANKVGFLSSYAGPILHDAGIVYSLDGDYILVILTNGENWEFIAQLSAWIDAQMRE